MRDLRNYLPRLVTLAEREREVLDHFLYGRTMNEVADDLGASHRSIQVHCARIVERIGAPTALEIAFAAGFAAGRAGL